MKNFDATDIFFISIISIYFVTLLFFIIALMWKIFVQEEIKSKKLLVVEEKNVKNDKLNIKEKVKSKKRIFIYNTKNLNYRHLLNKIIKKKKVNNLIKPFKINYKANISYLQNSPK